MCQLFPDPWRNQTSDNRCYFHCFWMELWYFSLNYRSIADVMAIQQLEPLKQVLLKIRTLPGQGVSKVEFLNFSWFSWRPVRNYLLGFRPISGVCWCKKADFRHWAADWHPCKENLRKYHQVWPPWMLLSICDVSLLEKNVYPAPQPHEHYQRLKYTNG